MNIRNIGVLIGKDVVHEPKGFLVIWGLIAPVVISLIFSLIFGTLFASKPELGVVDPEGSFTLFAEKNEIIDVVSFMTVDELRRKIEQGHIDYGVIIPTDYVAKIRNGEGGDVEALVWGESHADDRLILEAAVKDITRRISGDASRVTLNTQLLGEAAPIPWSERMLPFLIMMAVFVAGIILTAGSLIHEKESGTLQALTVTPISTADLFIAKAIVTFAISIVMAIIILVMNNAWGNSPGALLFVLFWGGIMAVSIGLMVGAWVKDMSTMFAVWKSGAVILFGPAIVYMFPKIPQWIGYLFPTYYMIRPIMQIAMEGAGMREIGLNVLILIAIDGILLLLTGRVLTAFRKKQQTA